MNVDFVVLRAPYASQPRKMVNLFCAPMKNMTTALRIEKAPDRLCQRYGVSGGLTAEPKARPVRYDSKVCSNPASLKWFKKNLNTQEV